MRDELRNNPRIVGGRRFTKQQPAIEGIKRTVFGRKSVIFPNLMRVNIRKEPI